MLQCEFVDDCKAMDMKQTSNCSGFKMFRPSSDVELYLFTAKKVKDIERPYNRNRFSTRGQVGNIFGRARQVLVNLIGLACGKAFKFGILN